MDFLEFLKFSKEDKHSSIILLMKIVISSLLTILIYRHLGGQVFIPKEITLSIILNFIFSYEILIPIVSVSIFILISYFIFPNLLRGITYFVTELAYFISKFLLVKLSIYKFLVQFTSYSLKHIFRIITISLPPAKEFEEAILSNEMKDIIAKSINKDYGILVLLIHLSFAYHLILSNNYIFINWIDSFCKITLVISILNVYFSILKATFLFHYSVQSNRLFQSIYKKIV
jgi:hypothetical protein